MPKFQQVPAYAVESTTPAEMAVAEVEYARLCQNPAYDMVKGPRRAAVAAKFASAMPLTPLEAIEFASIVPDGYRVGASSAPSAAAAIAETAARNEWANSERIRRDAENAKHRAFTNVRDAQAFLSPADYQTWLQTPMGQKSVAETYG